MVNWPEFIYNFRCNAAWLLDQHLLNVLVRFPKLASEVAAINPENATPFRRVGYATLTDRWLWLDTLGLCKKALPCVHFFAKAACVANHIMREHAFSFCRQ